MQPKTERPDSDNVRQRKPNPEPAEGSPKAKNYTPEQDLINYYQQIY